MAIAGASPSTLVLAWVTESVIWSLTDVGNAIASSPRLDLLIPPLRSEGAGPTICARAAGGLVKSGKNAVPSPVRPRRTRLNRPRSGQFARSGDDVLIAGEVLQCLNIYGCLAGCSLRSPSHWRRW